MQTYLSVFTLMRQVYLLRSATGIETYWYQYDPEYQPKINAAMHNDPTRLAESEI